MKNTATTTNRNTKETSMYQDYDEFGDYDQNDFADPGGKSALRAAGPNNPRNLPCPNCGQPNRLTPKDVKCGYQCDTCADQAEMGF